MTDFIRSFGPDALLALAAIGGTIITVAAIVAVQWRKVRQADFEASLKHDMLNRGMSAEDIERVIKASITPRGPKCG